MSPVYKYNSEIFGKNRTDNNFLKYYLKPSEGVQSQSKNIVELANEIIKGISDNYSKAKVVHDWVANNIYYNYDAVTKKRGYGNNSASGILKSRCGICRGYSHLYAALLRAIGIPAKVIKGYAFAAGNESDLDEIILDDYKTNHVWNEVFIDNRWILVDVTWDSRNRYENEQFFIGEACSHKYFDITLESFSANHKLCMHDLLLMINGFWISDYHLLFRYEGKDKIVTVPSIVMSIGFAAFACGDLNLTKVIIPDGVIRIESMAFYNRQSLVAVVIPKSVIYIGDMCFEGCNNLTIYGDGESYAEKHARNNNIKFLPYVRPALKLQFLVENVTD